MVEEPPKIDSRTRRLVLYVQHNQHRMLVDLLVIWAWIIAAFSIFAILGLWRWLLYIVVFAGVIVYTRITPPWERPYRSPDLET